MMEGFDFFDTSAWAEPEPPAPSAPRRPPTGNPILDPIRPPSQPVAVAKCSRTVAAATVPEIGKETAENREFLQPFAESVATVATVADCQAGIGRLALLPRLPALSERRWRQVIEDAESFERVWLDRAVGLGWSVQDMFGCYRDPLARRLDHEGLVHSLHGRVITELEADHAKILADRRGTLHTFSRSFDRSAAVPLWIAYSGAFQ